MRAAQEASIRLAHNRGARWTDDEDAYLIERNEMDSTATLAKLLNRTYLSVHSRRHILRRRGLLD